MGMFPELNDLSVEELLDCFHAPPPEGWYYAFVYYSEVTLKIRQREGSKPSALWKELKTRSAIRKRAVVFALSTSGGMGIPPHSPQDQERLRETLHKCLNNRNPLVIAEAIDGFEGISDRNVKEEVLSKMNHPSPYVKGSVLRYMSRLFPELAPPMLIKALEDKHFIVRENGVDEIGDLGLTDLLPRLRPMLNDPHPHVRQATESAIEYLEELLEES